MISRTTSTPKKSIAKDNKQRQDGVTSKNESDGGRDREDDEKSLFSGISEGEKNRQNYGGLLE
jgi:hypothetical protein